MSNLRRPIRELLRDGVEAQRLDATWQAIEARRKSRTLARRALLPALAACVALLGLLSFSRLQHDPARDAARAPAASKLEALAFADGQALSSVAAIEVAASAPARVIELSDGTRIGLAPNSRVVPRVSSPAHFELAVERGRARFEVQPQRGRSFAVSAGALRVEVVGTVFSVANDAHGADVAVEHGRVRVSVPGAPASERFLGAGESLRWPLAAPSEASQVVPAQAPAVPPSAQARPTAELGAPTVQAATPPSALAQSAAFRASVASGDYAHAYALLGGERGYARAVHGENATDALLQLADVARGAGQPRSAALALARILERHPTGDQSALAALTLGRLQLDVLAQPKAAAHTLRIALAAGLPVALQEDALARLVGACARAGERADAESAAEQYRKRFPNGRWRASVEQWVLAR